MSKLKALQTAGHYAWDISKNDISSVMRGLKDMTNTILWQHVQKLLIDIQERRNKIDDICSIEIGAGLGKLSCLLGLYGVTTTLLESSQVSLRNAKELGKKLGLHPKLIFADALYLPEQVRGKYDLAVSLGVNEHFLEEARQKIFDAHCQALKLGGWAVISVPNSMCICYRLAMQVFKWTKRWPEDLIEKPFTKGELKTRMKYAGFKKITVWSGSKPKDDFHFFFISNVKALLRKISGRRSENPSSRPVTVKELCDAIRQERAYSPFISNHSYSLLAIGQRQ